MHCSGTLPKDLAGHDSWSHDSQQDAVFHGCPASHVADLQLHTSQRHWRGASCGELDQCRARLGAPVLAATAESPSPVVGWAICASTGKSKWSRSMMIMLHPSNTIVDSCIGAPSLHNIPRWRILHMPLTAPWFSHCPAMPARCCTPKTPARTSGWSCQSASCCLAMATNSALASFTYPRCHRWQVISSKVQ